MTDKDLERAEKLQHKIRTLNGEITLAKSWQCYIACYHGGTPILIQSMDKEEREKLKNDTITFLEKKLVDYKNEFSLL